MANRFAIAAGDFSDTAIWSTTFNGSGGASVPVAGDSAMANNKIVQITADVTCTDLRNDTQGSAVGGGYFNCATAGVTITANVQAGGVAVASKGCLTTSNATGTVTVTGNVTAGTVAASHGLRHDGAGALSVVGNVAATSTSVNGINGILHASAGSVSVVGAVTGPAGTGNTNSGISVASSGTLSITGTVTGGATSATNTATIQNASTGVVTITGTVTGGNNTSAYGVQNTGGGTVAITGTCTGGSVAPAVLNNGTAPVTINGTLQAGGVPAVGGSGVLLLSGPLKCHATTGVQACYANKWLWATSLLSATYIEVLTESTLTMRKLYTADSVGGNPSIADVRSGTVFGPASELTGTCAVPAAGSVALGVPVDATTGTAGLTPTDLLGATLLARMGNCSTVESVGDQLAALGV